MKVYNQDKTEILESYDLTLGYLVPDKIVIAEHPATEEVMELSHYEILCEHENGGKDVRKIIDVPYQPAKEAWTEYEDIMVYIPYTAEELKTRENNELNAKFIPSAQTSMSAFAVAYLAENPPADSENKIKFSGLYKTWELGNYKVGDIRNHAGQTWECHQAHDNSVYPDINPDNPQTWATFWRPLHGKSAETARPWTKPWAGTTDMYHAGEYMIFEEKTYKCLSDTVYSPKEYAAAWQLVAA